MAATTSEVPTSARLAPRPDPPGLDDDAAAVVTEKRWRTDLDGDWKDGSRRAWCPVRLSRAAARALGAAHQVAPAGGRAVAALRIGRRVAKNPNRARELKVTFRAGDEPRTWRDGSQISATSPL